jgi:tetratricopeptide (TPR) repeat protein
LRLLCGLLCGLLGAVGAAAQELSSTPREVFREGYAWHTGEGRTPDLTKALRFYRQAIKADPDLFEAFSNAGLIYIALEDYKNAEYYLGQAIRLAREREDIDVGAEAKVSSDMGSCYYKWGDYREAEKWFRGAIRIDPGLSEARYNLIKSDAQGGTARGSPGCPERGRPIGAQRSLRDIRGQAKGEGKLDRQSPVGEIVGGPAAGGFCSVCRLRGGKGTRDALNLRLSGLRVIFAATT